MVAKQLQHPYPSISDDRMNTIYQSIISEIEDLRMGDGFTSIEKQYPDGIDIDVEVDAEGFSFRRIELIKASVNGSSNDKQYSTDLFNMLLNHTLELNWIEEEQYYSKEYAL